LSILNSQDTSMFTYIKWTMYCDICGKMRVVGQENHEWWQIGRRQRQANPSGTERCKKCGATGRYLRPRVPKLVMQPREPEKYQLRDYDVRALGASGKADV
jgi:hypothetical protein